MVPLAPATILGIGGGPGIATITLAKATTARITATDTDAGALDRLRDRLAPRRLGDRVEVRNADMAQMPAPDRPRDVIRAAGRAEVIGVERALPDWRPACAPAACWFSRRWSGAPGSRQRRCAPSGPRNIPTWPAYPGGTPGRNAPATACRGISTWCGRRWTPPDARSRRAARRLRRSGQAPACSTICARNWRRGMPATAARAWSMVVLQTPRRSA